MKYDLAVKNALLHTGEIRETGTLAVNDGRIAAIFPRDYSMDAHRVIDADGLLLLPGGIDTHVHFEEPGCSAWEDWKHATHAAAAGGVTTVVDMPIDNVPPVTDAETLKNKRAHALEHSLVDFCLWGGVTDDTADNIAGQLEAGAVGIKAFLSDCGDPAFAPVCDETLRHALKETDRFNSVLTLHCEDQDLIDDNQKRFGAVEPFDATLWSRIRSVEGEISAVERVIHALLETGGQANICHVSHPEVLRLIDQARASGARITAETCAHYLQFCTDDAEKLGSLIKCAPPIRDSSAREGMWRALKRGSIQFVGSDHSPITPDGKSAGFRDDWAGISGVQCGLNVLYDEGVLKRDLSLDELASVFSGNAARMLGLWGRKGALRPGFDADFVLFDPQEKWTLTEADYHPLNKISPYIGKTFRGRVVSTFLRGSCIYGKHRTGDEISPRMLERDRRQSCMI